MIDMMNLGEGVLYYWDTRRPREPGRAARLTERILALVTIFGLICLCVGLPLFLASRAWNDSMVNRVGAYILVIGFLLIALRIIYWIAEEMVGRGLESMARESN